MAFNKSSARGKCSSVNRRYNFNSVKSVPWWCSGLAFGPVEAATRVQMSFGNFRDSEHPGRGAFNLSNTGSGPVAQSGRASAFYAVN